ncbi:hypothetical protein E1B28_008697 [Marasmius oreades]|uniref:Methyltransferase-domain-containing protein n=1 Tax=Marasmius oreades TaxID=181124 RepID=A0A9P7RYX3_9AGAR|nr:uncharacterized protein E1B28_008697 [Marasmius oreades]KAG7092336.1 hypothetical protein E1B28_008697 [Marasmius oreades]
MPRAAPAHITKHLPVLDYPFTSTISFQLLQSDNGSHNGTTLWLGAQCLSAYLRQCVKPAHSVIELGSGIGLTSLVLSSLGWKKVVATDTASVISSVLSQNITNNSLGGDDCRILVRELDWTISPERWTWDNDYVVTSASYTSTTRRLSHPFDLIVTADTVYEPSLLEPLLRTIHGLCTMSVAVSPNSRAPMILLCFERRDPVLVDSLLAAARNKWNFRVNKVPGRKLSKAMEKSGLDWRRSDWEGVEVWKFVFRRAPLTA